jgi:hypothetical protein
MTDGFDLRASVIFLAIRGDFKATAIAAEGTQDSVHRPHNAVPVHQSGDAGMEQ